jgi:putative DNA methylase
VTRSLIEQWLPAATIGAESLRERGSAKAYPPINFLHVWWARRPLMASRAAVVGSLLPAWPTEVETTDPHMASLLDALRTEFPGGELDYHTWFVRSLGILGDSVAGRRAIQRAVAAGTTTAGNAYGYERAFSVSPEDATIARFHRLAALRADTSNPPTVLDPFAGGGSIPFEAARYGCRTIAGELNTVAAAILHGTVELPSQLGPAFADVIQRWGNQWSEKVRRRLARFFPHTHDDERLAYIWAHTVPCPTSGLPTPLAPDLWLARGKAGRDVAIRLEADPATGTVSTAIVEGQQAAQYGGRVTYKDGTATSIWTGETFSGEYIQDQAQVGRMSTLMLAVSVTRPGVRGRQFRAPSDADRSAVAAVEAELERCLPKWDIVDLVPSEPIDSVSNYDRGHRMYGINRWSDFFLPRQLLTHISALEELHYVLDEAREHLDTRHVRALALYLAFALDKAVDYSSRQSSWDATRLKVRNTFDKHNFAFKWTFAEFDGAQALIPWAVQNAVMNHTKICALLAKRESLLENERRATATILLSSATDLPLDDESVDAIVTDPPYYDNVMYGECSDFFYVWLKRSLRTTWPELCTQGLSNKEAEAIANPALFRDVASSPGRGKRAAGAKTAVELADAHYEHLLTLAFEEAHRVLKADGVLTVMFTHKRVDAWDTLGAALLEAGFAIHSSWPVHTESEHSLHQAKKNAASSTIFLTCRKRQGSEPAYWVDIRRDVEFAAEQAVLRFAHEGMAGVDLTIATYGPALSVLSRRWPVYTGELDEAGNPLVLRPDTALDLAREKVAALKKRGLLGGREVDFDRVTDWYLLAWHDFQAAEFPSGEALKLSIATHLDLDDLARRSKVVKASGGFVTLLTPAQRRTAGALDPDAGSWPTMLDGLHALMLTYAEEGLAAARAWLNRTGKAGDPRFHDLVEAALHAIPRTKDKGEFVRPEARGGIVKSCGSSICVITRRPPGCR